MTKTLKPIDRRVAELCREMNALPGIFTCSSCGGHAKRTNVSQEPRGRFYVTEQPGAELPLDKPTPRPDNGIR
jgi:tRNA(Phe) wybutosine-synthesizing methylase Tyw3